MGSVREQFMYELELFSVNSSSDLYLSFGVYACVWIHVSILAVQNSGLFKHFPHSRFAAAFFILPLNLRRMYVIQIHGYKNVGVKSIYSQTCRKISGVISVENFVIEFCFAF